MEIVQHGVDDEPSSPGVAKSHDEVTFYRFHNTYYTTLLTYPREIKNSENTSAYDEQIDVAEQQSK